MLNAAQQFLESAPWMACGRASPIFADAVVQSRRRRLRDWLDPKDA